MLIQICKGITERLGLGWIQRPDTGLDSILERLGSFQKAKPPGIGLITRGFLMRNDAGLQVIISSMISWSSVIHAWIPWTCGRRSFRPWLFAP